MSEERTEVDGVVSQGIAQTGVPTTDTTAGNGETQPTAQAKVDLGDNPEFREWQSRTDRRVAEAENKAKSAEKKAAQLEQEVTDRRLADLPLSEREQVYQQEIVKARTKARELEEGYEQERQAQEQAAQLNTRATRTLKKMGVDQNHPDLRWGKSPSPESYANLMESAAVIVANRGQAEKQVVSQQTDETTRDARRQALTEAGVTRVSTATPGAQPSLAEGYRQAISKISGGDRLPVPLG